MKKHGKKSITVRKIKTWVSKTKQPMQVGVTLNWEKDF